MNNSTLRDWNLFHASKMNMEHWREKLSALDLVRKCLVPASEDSCWLCDDLVAWNAVLHPLQLHLAEKTLGVLCLYKMKTSDDYQKLDTGYHSTFFTVWLPKKHKCVQEVKFYGGCLHFKMATIFDTVAPLSPSNLRHISIEAVTSLSCALLLDVLDPLKQLEELKLSDIAVTDSLSSKLARLLVTNADTLREFHLSRVRIPCNNANILVRCISKCKKLKDLSFDGTLSSAGLRDLTTLLNSAETLEKLSLSVEQSWGVSNGEERNYEKSNEGMLAAVGDLVRRNTILTELRFCGHQGLLVDVLNALESNDALRCLTIDILESDLMDHGLIFAEALKSMLTKNKGLCSLCLVDFQIDYNIAVLMSEGLQANTTLGCLDLTSSFLSSLALGALCSVLRANRTLRSLKVGSFWVDTSESMGLAKLQSYGRLHMVWHPWNSPGLSSALLEPLVHPTELSLDTLLFSEEAFSAVCNEVTSSVDLEKLTVSFCNSSSAHLESLCEALKMNKSLKYVALHEDTTSLHAAATAARSLCSNKVVIQLQVLCNRVDETSASMFASLLLANESIQKVQIESARELTQVCKDMLSQALSQNQFITSYSVFDGRQDSSSVTVEAALQRNITHLHRAARFVLGKNTGKVCAEAFEHLRSKSQLLGCVMSVSDMSESEAKAAVKSAGLYVHSDFLFINRVVCHKVECHAGEGVQIDQLTHDCWLAITKYLKVSDIAQE